jgi:hypothetical protein
MAVMSFDVEKNKAWLAGKPGARCAVLGGFSCQRLPFNMETRSNAN